MTTIAECLASLALEDHFLALVLKMVLVLVNVHVKLIALLAAPVWPIVVAFIL